MSNSQDGQLDSLLSDWARKTASSAKDCETLTNTISQRLELESPAAVELAPLRKSRNRWPVVAAMTISAAALFLIAVGLWTHKEEDGVEGSGPKRLPLAGLSQADPDPMPRTTFPVSHQKRLWQEHYHVFGPQLAWIADRGGQTEIGLSDSAADSRSGRFVGIHLILWSRAAAGGKWQQVQTFRVLADPEHFVQVPSDRGASEQLEIWAYPLDQGMVSIDLSFRPDLPGAPTFKQSVLQRLGEYTRIGDFERDGIEYRLYQSADLVPNGNLG